MRAIGLVIALSLIALGLYRLYNEQRKPRRLPERPARKPNVAPQKTSASNERADSAPASSKPAASKPVPSKPAASKPAASKPAASKPEPRPAARAARTEAAEPRSRPEPQLRAVPRVEVAPSPISNLGDGKMHASMLHAHDDEDITIITLAPPPDLVAAINALAKADDPAAALARPPRLVVPTFGEDEDDDDMPAEAPSAVPIVFDEDAAVDEPTRVGALILVSAAAVTDQGRRRRRNEDSLLVLDDHHLFVVADGMGGHAGGDVASKMAVDIIGDAFKQNEFTGPAYPDVPRRGAELAMAIQMANKAIYEHARANSAYQGMGTTVVSARFSPNKQRVYLGHVGDSRAYRLRGGKLTQITTDHTMGAQGVTGPLATHLNRAVGVQMGVKVDLLIARPRPEDAYLLCTDGLSKMVDDDEIESILKQERDLNKAVVKLVERANAKGGRDNITVILVQVKDPKSLAKYVKGKVENGR